MFHDPTSCAGDRDEPGVPLYALVMLGALRLHDPGAARPPDADDHASD